MAADIVIRELTASDVALLRRVEPVHRQLRPGLETDYPAQMKRMMDQGVGMAGAFVGDVPAGVAVWRHYLTTYRGHRFFVDDLVTDEAARSTGVGAAMLAWLQQRARALGCDCFDLDSGCQRERAHAFYFREGLTIQSFAFRKLLK